MDKKYDLIGRQRNKKNHKFQKRKIIHFSGLFQEIQHAEVDLTTI
jgi:hypothetical protein